MNMFISAYVVTITFQEYMQKVYVPNSTKHLWSTLEPSRPEINKKQSYLLSCSILH